MFVFIASEPYFKPRLVSSDSLYQGNGRLEVYRKYSENSLGMRIYYGYPICITDFDIPEADVFCRELGYLHSLRYDTVVNLR